ncbi:unnamed protein product [Vicia faba]|uniref:Uncharacterized protein n=1 Tax=Vicia faba TaxID=3906 RepID=A0AAV0YJM0_VICFA|nr:unnamed protein product [Vicia faba]
MHIMYKLMFKILICSLIPREDSTNQIPWDHKENNVSDVLGETHGNILSGAIQGNISIISKKNVKKSSSPLRVSYACYAFLYKFIFIIQKVNQGVTMEHIKEYIKETDMSLKKFLDKAKVVCHSSRKRKLTTSEDLKKS